MQGNHKSRLRYKGNADDRSVVPQMTANIKGARRLKIITGVKRSMKNILMPFEEKILLRKRSIVETVFDYLKNKLMLKHSRHRSFVNMLVRSTLTAYQLKPTKPSICPHCHLFANS